MADFIHVMMEEAVVSNLFTIGHIAQLHEIQAKRFRDLGVARELGLSSFEAYLARIPEIPAEFTRYDPDYPYLVLVEPRLGLKKLCDLGNIGLDGGTYETFAGYGRQYREVARPYWIRVQDGRRNSNRSVRHCRKSFDKDELGLTALQGVCTFLHHSLVVTEMAQKDGHAMDLPGSVLRDDRRCVACLGVYNGQPALSSRGDSSGLYKHGSASRRKYKIL